MACSQTEFSLATETVEGLENEEFQEKLDEEEKNKSLKTFPLCTSARREYGEENNNKKKTNGEEMIYSLAPGKDAVTQSSQAAVAPLPSWQAGGQHADRAGTTVPTSPPCWWHQEQQTHLSCPESCLLSCPSGRNNLAEAVLGFPSQTLKGRGRFSVT